MTTSSIPSLDPYDSTTAKALLAQLDQLNTFADVESWDSRARQEIARIGAYLDRLAAAEAHIAAAEARARELHKTKSFLQRTLTSPAEARAADIWRKDAAARREVLLQLSDQLEAAIDKTPSSRDEQREMIHELKLVKKELALRKREANESMRQIRTGTRQRGAKIGTGLSAVFHTPTTRRWSRIGLRLEKEAAVAPHETTRAQLEGQILVVERAIHWVQRFR